MLKVAALIGWHLVCFFPDEDEALKRELRVDTKVVIKDSSSAATNGDSGTGPDVAEALCDVGCHVWCVTVNFCKNKT